MEDINREIFELGKQVGREELLKTLEDKERDIWRDRAKQLWDLLKEIENLPVNYPYCPSDEARRIAKKRHDICTIYKKRDKR